MNDDRVGRPGAPLPLSLLADLQAGLLDDASAAALRRRIRADPEVAHDVAALDRVRRELAELGADATSAPEAPADVVGRVDTALRVAGRRPPARNTAP